MAGNANQRVKDPGANVGSTVSIALLLNTGLSEIGTEIILSLKPFLSGLEMVALQSLILE
jgi:hypothetical protein